jgi:hypothetical protein
MMATEQQWEYCQLHLEGWRCDKGKWYYDLLIRYFGPQHAFRRLSESQGKGAKAWAYNPWERALGLLGLAGWEMVHVQHGVYILNMGGGGQLLPDNCVAYFKRPVLAGRGVREPELQLP